MIRLKAHASSRDHLGFSPWPTVAGAAVCLILAACGSKSPASPSPTVPDVQGQYVGTYLVAACSDDGFLAATCLGQTGRVGQVRLNLSQAQTAVSGSIELSGGPIGTSGAFQGSVTVGGSLTGAATLGTFMILGVSQVNEIAAWNTTFSAGALSGSFMLVSRTASPSGSRTITASIQGLVRVSASGTVGGLWSGRAAPADGSLSNTSNVTMVLTQNGAGVTGTITLVGLVDGATYRGPVSGTVSDTALSFTFTAPSTESTQACGVSAGGTAQVGPGGPPQSAPGSTIMTGTYTGTNSCPGGRLAEGQFTLIKQ